MVRRNVVLTGFMGTGKTTVGRALAELLDYRFVDTDDIIETRHGAIHEIFAEQGEDAFREMERAVGRELAKRCGLVIATGGRMMLDPENVASLRDHDVFCLVASVDTIVARVLADAGRVQRPLMAGPDPAARARELLEERAPLYARFEAVETDDRTPIEIAQDIRARISS